jgi:hypothetical protein
VSIRSAAIFWPSKAAQAVSGAAYADEKLALASNAPPRGNDESRNDAPVSIEDHAPASVAAPRAANAKAA